MKHYSWIIAVFVIVSAIFIGGCCFGRSSTPGDIITLEMLKLTQDSVRTTMAELRNANDMIVLLRDSSEILGHRARVSAVTIADLRVKLAKISGGGISDDGTGGWRVYQDKFMTAFYKPDSLTYTLEPRPVEISLVEGMDNNWSCYGRDMLADAPAVISSFEVQRNRDYQMPRPWYKKLGTIAKYVGIGATAGGLGYMAGRIF
jgi:hypothetical protein